MGQGPHIGKNRAYWDALSRSYQDKHGGQLSTTDLVWGVWSTPESEIRALGDVAGKDVLELGCGGAQWSIALARRGARCTGLDFSAEQLAHAAVLIEREGARITLVHASAEETGLPDASFDVVFCDHGAMTFADPLRTVPEAARLLRKGGLFAFNMSTPILDACFDDPAQKVEERLVLPILGMHRLETSEADAFQLSYGEWIRLFRRSGLSIEDLIEIRPPPDATTTYEGYAPLEWARRWPAEHIWKLRKE